MSFCESFEHRDALLSAAVDAFVERGYEGASLNAILTAAGMSKGQFYHHFGSKQDLYLAVCEAMINRKAAWFAEHPLPQSADPFAAIEASLRSGLAFARDNPDLDAFGRAFLRERGRPIFDLALRTFPITMNKTLQEAIGHGLTSGAFSDAYTPAFVGRAIAAVLASAGDLLDPDNLDRSVKEIAQFLRCGLERLERQGVEPIDDRQDGP